MNPRWPGLLALFSLASFMEAIFWGQMGAFTPLHLPHLGVPADQVTTWVGLITSLSTLLGLPFLPFWGALADRYGRQPVIVRSFVAHLAAAAVCLLARDVWVFLLGRALMSLSLGNTGLMLATLAERAPARRLGLVFALMNSAAPVGVFLGPLLGGPLLDARGFGALLAINAGIMLAVSLGLWFGYRDPFTPAETGPLLGMAADSVRLILRSPRLRALFPALFLLFAGWMLALAYLPLAITALYRGPDPGTAVGLVFGVGGLATLVLGPAAGALADRFGHWRVLFAAAALSVLLWPLPGLARDLPAFAALWTLLNSVVSTTFTLSFNVLSSSATAATRGRVMSFAYLPTNIGGLIGPALGSLLTRGSVFAVFPAAAALTALGLLSLYRAYRR